ncbi:MAG: NAD(P)-dependent oxidoreductase [Planctomycetota bacterium]
MRIAVTGATGFLGQSLVDRLVSQGHQIRALSRQESPLMREGVDWVRGNLDEGSAEAPPAADDWLADCDAVVHAALSRADASFMTHPSDPIHYYRTNVIGTLRLLEGAINHGVSRFIQISSGAVHQRIIGDRPLDETHPMTPGSLYGAVKSACETLVTAYAGISDLKAANLRPVSIYGIEPCFEASKYFGLLQSIVDRRPIDVSGGGKVVHVDDVAVAAECLLKTNASIAGETYHCCDRFVSHYEVATIALRHLDRTDTLEGAPRQDAHPIEARKIRDLGMEFGGSGRLESTIKAMIDRIVDGKSSGP